MNTKTFYIGRYEVGENTFGIYVIQNGGRLSTLVSPQASVRVGFFAFAGTTRNHNAKLQLLNYIFKCH
jgi:hypothetical protein